MEPQHLSDLLRPESVIVPLQAESREAAIEMLISALRLPGSPQDGQALKAAILSREQVGSTGIGNGVAIPHARSPKISAPILAAGLAARAIDFKSADGAPATVVFLLTVPEKSPASHLKALAALSRIASDKKLLRRLNKASSSQEFYDLIAGSPV